MKRFLVPAAVALAFSACGSPADFTPADDSYRESRATIEGVAGRTIAAVDSTFFGRYRPLLGRLFLPQEHREGRPVAILSHTFWVEEIGERPDIIGHELDVAGVPRTVVGIMPAGVDVPGGVALWIPGEGS